MNTVWLVLTCRIVVVNRIVPCEQDSHRKQSSRCEQDSLREHVQVQHCMTSVNMQNSRREQDSRL